MAFKDTMNKVKDFFLKDGKRNLIITCAIVLIGAAVWLNFIFFANNDEGGFDYTGNTGMSGELDNSKNPTNDNSTSTGSDSYFATVQVSRQRAREEALEVLNAVIENDKATDAVKAEAVEEIKKISLEMEQEADIESLIVSKGFEQCVAVVNGETASIVVKCSGKLTPTQLAQINASVYEITGIEPINITIVGRE